MSKKVFILGAGSSIHVGGPLNKDWVGRIKKNGEIVNYKDDAIKFLDRLPGFTNVEALLSLIDLSIMEQHNYLPLSCRLDYLQNMREQLIDCIVFVANEYTEKTRIDPLLTDFFKKVNLTEGDTVINFNYDLAADWSLSKTNLWNPYRGIRNTLCGYGFGLGASAPIENMIRNSNINYFKLHGSINWQMNDALVELNWDVFNPDPKNISKTILVGKEKWSNFIITPSFIKTFENMPLRMLWRYAYKEIADAAEIYIVGYSFPKADSLARQILLNVSDSINKIIVIDPLSVGCSKSDKREDIISMLPWQKDYDFWKNKIAIIKEPLEQYTKQKEI